MCFRGSLVTQKTEQAPPGHMHCPRHYTESYLSPPPHVGSVHLHPRIRGVREGAQRSCVVDSGCGSIPRHHLGLAAVRDFSVFADASPGGSLTFRVVAVRLGRPHCPPGRGVVPRHHSALTVHSFRWGCGAKSPAIAALLPLVQQEGAPPAHLLLREAGEAGV